MLKWIFSVQSSESGVCTHWNSNPTNWSLSENDFFNEPVLSEKNDTLCWRLQIVDLPMSLCKHVHSFLVIIVFKRNMTNVKRAINKGETNVSLAAKTVKEGECLNWRSLVFSGYSKLEREENQLPLKYKLETSGPLWTFNQLVKKVSDKGSSKITSGLSS